MRDFSAAGALRQIGPRPVKGGARRLCTEAGTYLDQDDLLAAATRRGFLPGRTRHLLTPLPAAQGLRLAVAWGPPLEPFALENVDMLQAMGLELAPLNVARDRELPPDVSGLLLAGLLDEEQLPAFAANTDLMAALATAIADGLPTLAMGGGTLLLLRRLADDRGRSHELAGVLPAEAELLEWYERPRYVRAQATRDNPFDEGENLLYDLFDLEFLLLEQESFAYHVSQASEPAQAEGFACAPFWRRRSTPRCPAARRSLRASWRPCDRPDLARELTGRRARLPRPCAFRPEARSSGWRRRRSRRWRSPPWRCTSGASAAETTPRICTRSPSCATASP